MLAPLWSALAAISVLASTASAGIALPAEPTDKTTPVQQRISFHDPTSVSVAWNTYQKTTKPCVKYGITPKSLHSQACSSTSITYATSRTWSNLVVINGLKPATVYYYQVVSTNSTVSQFMSPRAAGDKTPFSMVTLADLGIYGEDGYTGKRKREEIPHVQPALNHTTIGSLAQRINEYEFIIHPGDFAYADDWIEDPTNAKDGQTAYTAIIENFYQQLEPITSNRPYQVSPGNHEANCQEIPHTQATCPAGQNNFSDFQNRWDGMMPTSFSTASTNTKARSNRNLAAVLARPPFWYSYDYGMAHIVMLSTETDLSPAAIGPDQPGGSAGLAGGPFAPDGQQIQFLKADLASVDRTITPWVIAAGHRPWYSNGPSDTPCTECKSAFEDVLYQYGVDLAAFGHVHNLQSFAPIYNGTVDPAGFNNPKAPAYIVIGGPGNIEGHSAIAPSTPGNVFAHNTSYGYGQLTFYNTTTMGINFFESATNNVLHTDYLHKSHTTPFVSQ